MIHTWMSATGRLVFLWIAADGWQGSCTRRVSLTVETANFHADALKTAPTLRKWTIDTCGEMDPVEALTSGLMQGQNALEVFKAAGVDAASRSRLFLGRTVSPHVLEGVAMTRAMRLLWQRWLDWQGFGQTSIWLDARTYIPSVGDGLPTDRLIGMTSAAYASAIGGSDALSKWFPMLMINVVRLMAGVGRAIFST